MIHTDILVIASQVDEAGMNLANQLMSIIEFEQIQFTKPHNWLEGEYFLYKSELCQLLIMSTPHYQADYLAEGIRSKLVIFLSKHISEAGQKAILVHSLGNWDKARHDSGQDYSLSYTSGKAMYLGYHLLKKQQQVDDLKEYWVGIEATHHGPTELQQPVLFVEIGGTIEEWQDEIACTTVAKAVKKLLIEYTESEVNLPVAIGIGGTHYARAFIDRMDAEMFAVSHVLPKYGIEGITQKQLQAAWDTTIEENKLFLIDKSGTNSKQRTKVEKLLRELGLPFSDTSQYSTSS